MNRDFARRMRLPMLFLGIAAGAITLLIVQARKGETLTAANLAEAKARWNKAAIEDYDFDVEIRGKQQGHHHVEVRGGNVVHMTTNGAEAKAHTYPFWNIEGMFQFLETELDLAERPPPGEGGKTLLTVLYDPEFGYPARFVRHQVGETGSMEWDIVDFRARPDPR